jgi:general stress protein CsbA
MWQQIVSLLLGLWLMAAPAVFGYGDPVRTNNHIVGPLVAAVATIAISEVTRPVRWVNVALGIWLLMAPWALGYGSTSAWVQSLVIGAALALLSTARGTITQRFGGGWPALWHAPAPDEHGSELT